MSNKKDALDKNRSGETLKQILKYISQYRWSIILSLFLALITVAPTLRVLVLIGHAVDRIVSAEHMDSARLRRILITILGVVAVTSVSQWLMSHINNIITYRVVKDVRTRAFNQPEVIPLSYVGVHLSGDIIGRIIVDVDQLSEGLLMGFIQLFTGVLTIAETLLFMLPIQLAITVVVVVLAPISLFAANSIARKTFVVFRKQSETRGELTSLTDEMLGNMKVIQVFGHQEEVRRQFEEINERLAGYSLRATFFSPVTSPVTRFVSSLVYVAVDITGAYGAIREFITVGQLISFLGYANQHTRPFNEISGAVTELQNALASTARVFELIDKKIMIEDREDATILRGAGGSVNLEQVCFFYTPEKKLIEDFSLSVQPRQKVVIVRPTGYGKTATINLLMRFHNVDSGTIKVGGTNIRDVTRENLRTSYGMALRGTWLKSGTVRDNIAYGHPDAAEKEIIQATKQAHAHESITRTPDGYTTVINEDGGNLSQGQKQLLCIARVVLCLPPMLILDETTSPIDTRTEIRVQKAFAQMMEGRTSSIVARRLSTIREADVILVMRDGKIMEEGKHEELLGMHGFYAGIYNAQLTRGQDAGNHIREGGGHMGDGRIMSGLYQKNMKWRNKSRRRKDVTAFLYILLGSLIVAVNMDTFARQGELVPGGFTELVELIRRIELSFYDAQISFTLPNVLFNAVPAVPTYRLVGKKFIILSYICLLTVSVLVDELPVVPITGDILLISVLGDIINDLGMSLVLNSRACGGGTGFITVSLSTEYKVSTFNYMLLFSTVVMLISGTIFGTDRALYSTVFQFYNTQAISTFYKKYKKKTLLIVTDNPAAVSADLLELTSHNSTILKDFGSYSANKKYLIYTVLSGSDVRKMKKRIQGQYLGIFANVIDSNDVVGNFYIQPLERSALLSGSAS